MAVGTGEQVMRKRMTTTIGIIGIILLFATIVSAAGLPNQENIQYNPDNSGELIDWYNPTTTGATCNGTTPLIIWAHGGGFTAGTKTLAYSLDPWKTLLENCYAIASVQYTLSPSSSMATSPIMPFSLARAVQYFRKNDANYNINEDKIIAMGQSAGADIWMYPVYGPDMNLYAVQDDLNSQNTRPNFFISIAGWTDINAMINTTTGALYNQPTLATVSVADKNRMSMISMLDMNATLFPNRVVPTLFLCTGASQTTLPILDPHDCYFGDIGLAKINQFNPNTGSDDINLPLYTNNAPYILNWLNTNVGSVLETSPNSLTFYDDFGGYNTSYASNGSYSILYDFNVQTGWTLDTDLNTGFFVPNFYGLDNKAISWPVDIDKNGASNVSSLYRTIPTNIQLRDWNSTGAYIYVRWKTDVNEAVAYLQLGLGQGINDYEIWRKGPTTDWVNPWNDGYTITRYDLNSPFPGKVGSPSFTDVNFMRLTVAYTGTQDFNLTVDRVWMENYPTSMDDTWVPYKDGNQLYGWSMPFDFTTQGTGMVVSDSNIIDTNSRGIVLNNTFSSLDITNYDFNITVDVNQVNTTNGTKLLFDFVDADNYSSCYINDINSTGRNIGVEQVVNGVHSISQIETNFAYGTYQTISCINSDGVTSVYLNSSLVLQAQGISRINGLFGIESQGGSTNIQDYYLTLTAVTGANYLYPFIANNEIVQTVENDLFPLLILAIFAGALIIGLMIAMAGGDIIFAVGLAIVGIAMLIVYVLMTSVITAVG